MKLSLRKETFWDSDLSDVDFNQHAPFIISRILMRGTLEEWSEARKFYGDETVLKVLLGVRYLDKKSLNYVSNFYNTPKENFRCYSYQQSNQIPWNF